MIDGRERYKVTGVRENQSYVGAMCVPIWSQTIPTILIEAAGCSDFNGECLHLDPEGQICRPRAVWDNDG